MLYQVLIPAGLLFLPWLVVRYVFATDKSRKIGYRNSVPYLAAAATLWFVGCALPEFSMFEGATDTFILHTIGGVVAAILFWYVALAYGLRFTMWWQEPVFLFAFASTLGVMNELLEFALYQTGLFAEKGVDTWWDLTANTLGVGMTFAVLCLVRRIRTSG